VNFSQKPRSSIFDSGNIAQERSQFLVKEIDRPFPDENPIGKELMDSVKTPNITTCLSMC
jgi:hypothetical protein